jgi:hypothetical protein
VDTFKRRGTQLGETLAFRAELLCSGEIAWRNEGSLTMTIATSESESAVTPPDSARTVKRRRLNL